MEKLKLRDFLNYNFLSNLEFSPNKENLAFTISKSDYESNKYKSDIYLFSKKDSTYRRLTGAGKDKSFIWLNDNTILFPSQRDEALKKKLEDGEHWTVYYTININGGEAEEYMRIPMSVHSIQKVNENLFALTADFDNNLIDLNGLKGEEREKAVAEIKDNKDYEVIDEIPFWSNGTGFVNKKRDRLYLYNHSTGELTPITDNFTHISSYKIKDNKILYSTNRYENKMDLYDGLYIYDIDTKANNELIAPDKYTIGFIDFMKDSYIMALSDMKTYGVNQNYSLYTYKDGNLTFIYRHDAGFGSSVGSDCRLYGGKQQRVYNDSLYFVSTMGKSSFLNKLTEDGNVDVLTEDKGSIDCFDIADDGIYFAGMRDYKLQEIYQLNGGEKQLTKINDDVIANKTIQRPEYFEFNNSDNVKLQGFIIKPVDYDPDKTYPGILDIHGGPKTVYGDVFYHEMQVWANMGYFVFFTNPRGSDGRGDEFADIRGKYGTIDYDDLMLFTDIVLEKYPQIDKSRIGVTGGSYGGYMTNWIIGHTDRFKCAVSQRSISNWISKFGTTDIGYYFNADQNQSTPWREHDKLWWHSPLKYADRAVTPTLFIHSEQDYRCWLAEGLQMFTALKYHGVEARLCMFRGENHELSRSGKPKHRVRRLEEMTNWFEKHLK